MDTKQLFNLISNVCGVDVEEISLESDFYEDLNCEQTALVELKLQIEDHIKSKIEDEDFENIETVEDLINLIEEYTNEFID